MTSVNNRVKLTCSFVNNSDMYWIESKDENLFQLQDLQNLRSFDLAWNTVYKIDGKWIIKFRGWRDQKDKNYENYQN